MHQKTMPLSDKTIEKLAEALVPEALAYIQQSEKYVEFMSEILTVFLKERMGEMDNEIAVKIIDTLISDKLSLVTYEIFGE